jgi:hypothetical protein
MSRPSEKACQLAEELVDYVHPGMSRAAAITEVAAMVDEMNGELVELVESLLEQAERTGAGQHAVLIQHLREIIQNYRPVRFDADGQHELFVSGTSTETAPPSKAQLAARKA